MPTASTTTANSTTISWTQISCIDRNGHITGYRILYGPVNTAPVTLDHQSTSTSRDFTGLSPFTNYVFSVSGVSSQGAGAFSAEAIFRTNEDRKCIINKRFTGWVGHFFLSWDGEIIYKIITW